MKKNKTAVEWLFEQIPFEWASSKAAFESFQQALQMEAEQIDYARRMSMLCSCDENEPTTKVHCCDTCGKIAKGYWVTKLHDYNPGC